MFLVYIDKNLPKEDVKVIIGDNLRAHLKEVFSSHAQIDPSITTSFDLYLQSCATGGSVERRIFNSMPPLEIPSNMNYWDKRRALLAEKP